MAKPTLSVTFISLGTSRSGLINYRLDVHQQEAHFRLNLSSEYFPFNNYAVSKTFNILSGFSTLISSSVPKTTILNIKDQVHIIKVMKIYNGVTL